jgi:hypothetical protein
VEVIIREEVIIIETREVVEAIIVAIEIHLDINGNRGMHQNILSLMLLQIKDSPLSQPLMYRILQWPLQINLLSQ